MADRERLDGAEPKGQAAFTPAASAGLFVGVSSFEDERIHPVPFAVDDAVDLAYLFTLELGLLLPERTVLLLAGEPRKPESIERLTWLVEHGARRQSARTRDIYRYLGEQARVTEERGLFVFTVATHGVSDQGGDFLVATESLKERRLRTGVAVAEVFDEVARAVAGRRLVLLDACRERLSNETRGETEAAMTQSFADAIASARGSVVLSGATLGGFAYDDRTRQNGVFTAAVIDGLRGEAQAGPEGWITVRTLADFVQQRVAEWVRRNRPDHAAKSLGIGLQTEANAGALPLALHPEAMRERQRYRARREAALARVRANLGKVLSGADWDRVAALLEEPLSPKVERLLEEIEALDGGERTQRSLRDFLRDQSSGASSSSRRRGGFGLAQVWLREKRIKVTFRVALIVLLVMAASYLFLRNSDLAQQSEEIGASGEYSPGEQRVLEQKAEILSLRGDIEARRNRNLEDPNLRQRALQLADLIGEIDGSSLRPELKIIQHEYRGWAFLMAAATHTDTPPEYIPAGDRIGYATKAVAEFDLALGLMADVTREYEASVRAAIPVYEWINGPSEDLNRTRYLKAVALAVIARAGGGTPKAAIDALSDVTLAYLGKYPPADNPDLAWALRQLATPPNGNSPDH